MKVSKNYHSFNRLKAELAWQFAFAVGKKIKIGKTYSAIRQRPNSIHAWIEGPFTALGYDSGILLVGDPGKNRYCVIVNDVVEVDGEIVTDGIRGGVFSMRRKLDEMPACYEEAIRWIRLNSQVKYFFALNEDEAKIFLRWYRSCC